MRYSFDPGKAAANLAKHGVAFGAIEGFEWELAQIEADTRQHYGEVRLIAVGPIGSRIHVLIYTVERRSVRLISLRKANRKEALRYAASL